MVIAATTRTCLHRTKSATKHARVSVSIRLYESAGTVETNVSATYEEQPMSYATYNRLVLETGEVHTCRFEETHFKEAGFPVIGSGMPKLEALELVNKWNRLQAMCKRFFYWLD